MSVPAGYVDRSATPQSCDVCDFYNSKIFYVDHKARATEGKCFVDTTRDEDEYIVHWVDSRGWCPRYVENKGMMEYRERIECDRSANR